MSKKKTPTLSSLFHFMYALFSSLLACFTTLIFFGLQPHLHSHLLFQKGKCETYLSFGFWTPFICLKSIKGGKKNNQKKDQKAVQ